MDKKFSENRLRMSYDKIIRDIKKYERDDILALCFKYLNEYTVLPKELLGSRSPWLILLVIKWTILNGTNNKKKKREFGDKQFAKLMNKTNNLGDKVMTPTDFPNILLFLKNIAFQQFWLQENININSFCRQSILFGDLADNHKLNTVFIDKTGVNINDFLELSFILIIAFIPEKNTKISRRLFDSVKLHYGENAIERFLSAVSTTGKKAKLFLTSVSKNFVPRSQEYYEQTPLKQFPLFIIGNEYNPLSKILLFRALENYIYDTLRENNAQEFLSKFGNIFERYVEKGLKYSGVNFINENELEAKLDGSGKIVDFLVLEDSANIFIDAKGVELSYEGKVSNKPGKVESKIKSSVIKGIEQSYSTAMRLKNQELDISKDSNYLIIITFKELYLGNGKDFYETIAKQSIDRIKEKYGNNNWINIDNMYFISIDDFDLLCNLCKSTKLQFSNVIEIAIHNDSDPESKKLELKQHIYERYPKVGLPDYLDSENSILFSRVISILKNTELEK